MAAALLCLSGCGEAQGPSPEYRPEEAGTVDHALCLLGFTAIPVQEVSTGHHLIEATINGTRGSFVLDTGANVTAIDSSRSQEFGLSGNGGLAGAAAAVKSAGGRSARLAQVDSFQLGLLEISQDRVVIADMGRLLGQLSRVGGEDVAGIVGQDVLKEHRAIIDVPRPMLYLLETGSTPSPVAAGECEQGQTR
ncbi:aspartyl protease family protein [Novosphingobium sp. M1R2S20]|uniref:Aspartyl protease family protein n=1 Tax=Novosphingobium rhizovicinum TaxID=3228928 RepID=A0ABV3RF94_9SPHN